MTARAASRLAVPGARSTQGLILNLALFQLGWWALVLSAAQGRPLIGLVIVALILAWHLGFVRPLRQTQSRLRSRPRPPPCRRRG